MGYDQGFRARVLIDAESAYGTIPDAASRRPYNLHYNSDSVIKDEPENEVSTLRGNRNPDEGFAGNVTVGGNMPCPFDTRQSGLLFKYGIAAPTSTEYAPDDDVMTGSPTLTITSTGASCTFSVAQSLPSLSRVVWENPAGTRFEGFITDADSDSFEISKNRLATATVANITAADVLFIARNITSAVASTITISGGVATFSQVHNNAALGPGNLIIYDCANTRKAALVESWTDTTHAVVTDLYGFPAPDCSALEVDSVEEGMLFQHVFQVHATADVPSFVHARGHTRISPAEWFYHSGCKINTLAINTGGDANSELLQEPVILGSNETRSATAYDATVPAIDIFGPRFSHRHGAATLGGSPALSFNTFSLSLNNNLASDERAIGSAGAIRHATEGIAQISGSINAFFESAAMLDTGEDRTTTSLSIVYTLGVESATLYVPQVKFNYRTPAVEGPQGVRVNLDWRAHMTADSAAATAFRVTLVNRIGAY